MEKDHCNLKGTFSRFKLVPVFPFDNEPLFFLTIVIFHQSPKYCWRYSQGEILAPLKSVAVKPLNLLRSCFLPQYIGFVLGQNLNSCIINTLLTPDISVVFFRWWESLQDLVYFCWWPHLSFYLLPHLFFAASASVIKEMMIHYLLRSRENGTHGSTFFCFPIALYVAVAFLAPSCF